MKDVKKGLADLAIIAAFFLCVYYFARIFLFFRAEYTAWDFLFALLLLAGETYMITHAFGFVINIIRLNNKKELYHFKQIKDGEWPSVAVAVAVRNEPGPIVEQTVITLKSLDYPNFQGYLLDGSTEAENIEQNRAACVKYGLKYFSLAHSESKAQTVNSFLKTVKEKYLAIFDADQNPLPSFLKETVAIVENNDRIAFVQTPQLYSNLSASHIAKGAAMQQSVFYESICEAKGGTNSMFCCGTNVIIRAQALIQVGGFDERSVTEDFSTSLKLHLSGYTSVYYNHVRVFGQAPQNLPAYFKQQARWSAGTAGVLRELIKQFFKNPRRLTLSQWWEYALSSSYYFIGWAFFLLMICPVAFLIFNVPSYFVRPEVYLATFAPYFVATFAVFYATMKRRNYKLKDVYFGIILGSLSFPILMFATLRGLLGWRGKFIVTPKGRGQKMSGVSLWPWTAMILLNVAAIGFGVGKFYANPYAVGVNIFWCAYHIVILSQIYYLND